MSKFDEGKFQAPTVQRQVTKEDVEKIFSLDAIYANKYFVTIQPDGMVRICFADTDPSGALMYPRCTVIMPYSAFASFAMLIGQNMGHIENMSSAESAKSTALPKGAPMSIGKVN